MKYAGGKKPRRIARLSDAQPVVDLRFGISAAARPGFGISIATRSR